MKKITKILALALALVFSISLFTTNSYAAARAEGQEQKRDLTDDEIAAITKIFNAKIYAEMYPDVVKELGTDATALLNHFITYGIWEERQPSDGFNVDAYASLNPDLQVAYGSDIMSYYMHYASHMDESGHTRSVPTLQYAIWHACKVYSVFDFTQGQKGPNAGAVPICTQNYHPGLVILDGDGNEIYPSVVK